MSKIWTTLLAFSIGAQALSQEHTEQTYTKEFRLVVDNDVFTSLYRDQYYTSGIFIYFRHLTKYQNEKYRLVRSYSVNHRMYTPQMLSWEDSADFDRPYAGLISFFFNHEWYTEKNQYFKAGLELGWMGPSTGTGEFQLYWHNVLGIVPPAGWQYQIGNSPIINVYGSHSMRLIGNNKVDLVSESNVAFGTAYNYIRQDMIFRLGLLKPVGNSSFFNGQLGSKKPDRTSDVPVEIFLFYSPGVEFNIYNTTIEGTLIGGESPHTETPVNWILQHRAGAIFSWQSFDMNVFYYFRTPETTDMSAHQYVGLHLNVRI